MNQFKIGAVLSYTTVIVSIIIALFYTPLLINTLGQSEYGLYSLIGSLAAYFSVMDFGLGNSIVRYTARNRALGNNSLEAQLNGLFFKIYTVIGMVTLVAGILLYQNVDYIFNKGLTVAELDKAKIMIIILTINFAFSFPLSIFNSLVRAYEKFILDKFISLVRIIAMPLITIPLLMIGYNSIMLVIVTTTINIICLSIMMIYCFKILNVKLKFKSIEVSLFREILVYSFFIFLGVVVDQINWKTNQVILGILSSTSIVAIYAIAMQFINIYIQFSTSISSLFLPKVSIMVANNATPKDLTALMIKYGRLQYIVISFIMGGFLISGSNFIELWAGSNFNDAYYIVLIIMIPLTIPLIQNTGLSMLWAKNLQKFRSITLLIIGIVNVCISIPLVKSYGGIGAAIGTSASLFLGNVLMMNLYYKMKLKLDIFSFWKNILSLSFPVLGSSLIVGLIRYSLPQFEAIQGLLINTFIYCVLFVALGWLVGLNKNEKNLFISFMMRR
ncbi:oligosaccharide flippase family protein [Terribacillus sp. DMT04]|uniref:oligosaccharide flippase family protein n=1 Tax=Terribacillus sp. DMT04 TaxID=2850441 RepID=UPI001C2C1960|nr:oligosaccharide flippase family protein [Terribacillus sp. DMT04]QXE01060.1 oligosaccharide flippase family protein [Terribacillus sp. DMT04]